MSAKLVRREEKGEPTLNDGRGALGFYVGCEEDTALTSTPNWGTSETGSLFVFEFFADLTETSPLSSARCARKGHYRRSTNEIFDNALKLWF